MAWKECCIVEERMRFIARLLEGEQMSSVCQEFGISRKTGYKIFNRYKDCGLKALHDRSRRPVRFGNQLPVQIEKVILSIKGDKPNWGAPKIREKLIRKFPEINPPAISTIHAVLDRNGLVTKRGRKRKRAVGTTLSLPSNPNDLWCADYKGQFMLGNKQYCYPLTITDSASRYLLACEALDCTKEKFAFTVFEQVFQEFGLPLAIRTDNGVPFASGCSLFNLSRLSVWWLRLGIAIERIKPGNPQQNGRHERMHLTLKKEATKPAGANFLQQQAKFDKFIEEYNNDRPHEALQMQYPGECYRKSPRPYKGILPVDYALHDRTINVSHCGRICIGKRKINFTRALAGQAVGISQVDENIWMVTFMDYDLGFFDTESARFEPAPNPFGTSLLPMS